MKQNNCPAVCYCKQTVLGNAMAGEGGGGTWQGSSGLVVGLSPWRIGFNAWLIHVWLVGDKVVMEQDFSSSTSVSPLIYHPTHSLIY
jgi:hypothetical protein